MAPRYWVAVRSWSWLCLLSCVGCASDGIETTYWLVHNVDAYEMAPDVDALDRALVVLADAAGLRRRLDRARKEQADLRLERAPFDSAWGPAMGLYSPPRTIRATWYDGDCIASGGAIHEMTHYMLDLDRQDIDHAHARADLWGLGGAVDRATDAAFAERLGCPQ